jgi:hypothetical protein
MEENNVRVQLRNGGVLSGYYLSMCGNYMILYTKEQIDDKIVITQTTHEMGSIERIVSTYDVERRDEVSSVDDSIQKELIVEKKSETN